MRTRTSTTRAMIWVVLTTGALSGTAIREVDAQSFPLQLEIRNQDKLRSNAPSTVDVSLVWNGPQGMQGSLELTLRDDVGHYGTARIADLTLNTGRNPPMQIMLPAVDGDMSDDAVDLRARFITSDGTYDLGSRPIRVPGAGHRVFRILHCDPLVSSVDPGLNSVIQSMRLERYWQARPYELLTQSDSPMGLPAELTGRKPEDFRSARPNDFETLIVKMVPSQLPTDPHFYCGYNIVVLSEAGLIALRETELKALQQWVRAGGSLCVEATGLLERWHLAFLNELANSPSGTHFQSHPNGRLVVPEDRTFELMPRGLGRVAVLYKPLGTGIDPDSSEWQQLVASLWHFREDQHRAVEKMGHFTWLNFGRDLNANQQQVWNQNGRQFNGNWMSPVGTPPLSYRAVGSGAGFLQTLMPSEVEVVPVELIALILVLYVLAIGPLDYFVLGALRLRRFTWITFPATTIAFTLFTVWLSNSYLSSSTERAVASFYDIGNDGEVARENRFELLYTASTHDVTTELRSSIFTPLVINRFQSGQQYYGYGRRVVSDARVSPPALVGRPPLRYDVTQNVPQWTPQINRIFRIAPEVGLGDKFDWKKRWNLNQSSERNQLVAAAQDAYGTDAKVILYGNGQVVSGNSTAVFERRHDAYAYHDDGRPHDFLTDVCQRHQGVGLFSIVSQVAPHGGDNFEDMTLIDPSNSNQWLLVVAVEDESGMKIYRRLYTSEESSS